MKEEVNRLREIVGKGVVCEDRDEDKKKDEYVVPEKLQCAVKEMIATAIKESVGVCGKGGGVGEIGVESSGVSYADMVGNSSGKMKKDGVKGKVQPVKVVKKIECEDRMENIDVIRISSKKEYPELRKKLVNGLKPEESGVMVIGLKKDEKRSVTL